MGTKLAHELGRSKSSVKMRIVRLKISLPPNGRVEKITDFDRQIIVDMVLEKRLPGRKLSDPKIVPVEEWKRLTGQFCHRAWRQIEFHWLDFMQPCLLQHYSGTLNLPIAKMLISCIGDNFGDSVIDWDYVIKRQEFVGHTIFSLKLFFHTLKKNCATKYKVEYEELKIAQVADYVSTKKSILSKSKKERQRKLIDYFERKVEELRVKDFV